MQATIHNEFLSLTVDTHGAEAVSLKNAAGEELLWQADPAVWKRHAPILFPWTGKLKDGSFTHGGKTYKGGQTRFCPGRGAHPAESGGRHHPARAAPG
mgnify:CR=1 FL=1